MPTIAWLINATAAAARLAGNTISATFACSKSAPKKPTDRFKHTAFKRAPRAPVVERKFGPAEKERLERRHRIVAAELELETRRRLGIYDDHANEVASVWQQFHHEQQRRLDAERATREALNAAKESVEAMKQQRRLDAEKATREALKAAKEREEAMKQRRRLDGEKATREALKAAKEKEEAMKQQREQRMENARLRRRLEAQGREAEATARALRKERDEAQAGLVKEQQKHRNTEEELDFAKDELMRLQRAPDAAAQERDTGTTEIKTCVSLPAQGSVHSNKALIASLRTLRWSKKQRNSARVLSSAARMMVAGLQEKFREMRAQVFLLEDFVQLLRRQKVRLEGSVEKQKLHRQKAELNLVKLGLVHQQKSTRLTAANERVASLEKQNVLLSNALEQAQENHEEADNKLVEANKTIQEQLALLGEAERKVKELEKKLADAETASGTHAGMPSEKALAGERPPPQAEPQPTTSNATPENSAPMENVEYTGLASKEDVDMEGSVEPQPLKAHGPNFQATESHGTSLAEEMDTSMNGAAPFMSSPSNAPPTGDPSGVRPGASAPEDDAVLEAPFAEVFPTKQQVQAYVKVNGGKDGKVHTSALARYFKVATEGHRAAWTRLLLDTVKRDGNYYKLKE